MSTVQKILKSNSLEEKYSEFLSSLLSLFFLKSQEEMSDSDRLLSLGFPERFAALWMFRC